MKIAVNATVSPPFNQATWDTGMAQFNLGFLASSDPPYSGQ